MALSEPPDAKSEPRIDEVASVELLDAKSLPWIDDVAANPPLVGCCYDPNGCF